MTPLFDDAAAAVRDMARGSPVYLLVNPIEYHGPHLSLRNDHLVSAGLARDLHAELGPLHGSAPLLVTRDLEVGVDPAPGPGSVPVPLAEVRRRVLEACDWLADHGAGRVVLMTFHGSPLHAAALEAGVRSLRRRGVRAFSPLNLVMRELLDLDRSRFSAAFEAIADRALRAELERELPHDFHAGFFETSMAIHYAPDTVLPIYRELPPCPSFSPERAAQVVARLAGRVGARGLSRELGLVADGLGWYALRPFPGYTGRPAEASAEAGAVFAREIVRAYAIAGRDVLYGAARSPAPILRWLTAASIGGRLGPRVPSAAVQRFDAAGRAV